MSGSKTREEILDAARDIYLRQGMDQLSMRKVADRVGITAMGIYRHFKDKADLQTAIIEQGFQLFFDYLMQSMQEDTAWDRFEKSGEQYLQFALDHPADYEMMLMRDFTGINKEHNQFHWRNEATFRFLVDRIRDCMDHNIMKEGDPEAAAFAVWSQSHGLVSLFLAGKLEMNSPDFSRYFRAGMGSLMQGLKC